MKSATRKQGKQIQTVYTPNRQVKTARSEILSFNKEERSSIPGYKLFPLTPRKHFPQGYKLRKFQRKLFCTVYQASPSLENEKKKQNKTTNTTKRWVFIKCKQNQCLTFWTLSELKTAKDEIGYDYPITKKIHLCFVFFAVSWKLNCLHSGFFSSFNPERKTLDWRRILYFKYKYTNLRELSKQPTGLFRSLRKSFLP